MDKLFTPTDHPGKLAVLALAAVPAASAVAVMLDQSMRRPSLARFVMQSLQLVF